MKYLLSFLILPVLLWGNPNDVRLQYARVSREAKTPSLFVEIKGDGRVVASLCSLPSRGRCHDFFVKQLVGREMEKLNQRIVQASWGRLTPPTSSERCGAVSSYEVINADNGRVTLWDSRLGCGRVRFNDAPEAALLLKNIDKIVKHLKD